MSHGYSVAQTARLVCALRWACGRLYEMLEAWAGQAAAGNDAEAAVRMAELSRRLGAHREVLDGLQPDSERMASWRQAAPTDPSLAAALDQIAALEGSGERLDVAREVLVSQFLSVYEEICEQAAPRCDAALASAARSLHDDLDRGMRRGGAAAHGAGRREAVDSAERVLSTAGGIVGAGLLRPEDWP